MNKQPALQSTNEIGVRRSLFDEKARRVGWSRKTECTEDFAWSERSGCAGSSSACFVLAFSRSDLAARIDCARYIRRSSPLAPIDARSARAP